MNKLLVLAAAMLMSAIIGGPAVISAESEDEIRLMQEEMLFTTVRVHSGSGSGSGTIIYSKNRWNMAFTYILTNYHVISASINRSVTPATKGNPRVVSETRYPVKVDVFLPSEFGGGTRITTETAEIVAYDKYRDLAVLRLDDHEATRPYVAAIADEFEGLEVFERAFAVGAGLGMVPFPTDGRISIVTTTVKHLKFISSSSPIIFGNSGGGLYTWDVDHYELVGVPSQLFGIGFGSVVSHIALSIPMDAVHYFLRSVNLEFIAKTKKS